MLAMFCIILLLFVNILGVTRSIDAPCDKSRAILSQASGTITHGPPGTNYSKNTHCEWLIKANSTNQFITLEFKSLSTECSYDYVFIYDGDSFNSPLLGSFSGKNQPQSVLASSGFMLILLFSDTNYALEGFEASYYVSDCPRNCSSHGFCLRNFCVCDNEWGGPDCGTELCPDKCGEPHRGVCKQGRCHCRHSYSGMGCTLNSTDSTGNRWHDLYQGGIHPRVAHSAVYISETDSLYVFGGYNLNNILGDLVVFHFNTSMWYDHNDNVIDPLHTSVNSIGSATINTLMTAKLGETKSGTNKLKYLSTDNKTSDVVEQKQNKPWSAVLHDIFVSLADDSTFLEHQNENIRYSPNELSSREKDEYLANEIKHKRIPASRFGHAATKYPGGFLMYGGKLKNGLLSGELWFYNVHSKVWSLRAQNSILQPPALTRHTLTFVEHTNSVYLVGGSNSKGYFSSKIFTISINTDNEKEQWKEVKPRGGKELNYRVAAHSTVYDVRTQSLIIYGGIVTSTSWYSKLSDCMFIFNIPLKHWSEIKFPLSNVPTERAFHSANIMGNYIVVFGGYTHHHSKEEICYDNEIYLYHLGCHTWLSRDVLGTTVKDFTHKKINGAFGHAADVRNGNTLILVGGYRGNIVSDLLAFVLPPTLVPTGNDSYHLELMCSRHKGLQECTANPECGWCSSDDTCYGRHGGINCTTNLQTTRCPGICQALTDCHSCLIHGESSPNNNNNQSTTSIAHIMQLGRCVWCIQDGRCHHKNDNYEVCGLHNSMYNSGGAEVANPDDCRSLDRRLGLTFFKYLHPANYSHPDLVSIVNTSVIDVSSHIPILRTEIAIGGTMVVRLSGFLRFPQIWDNHKDQLQLCSRYTTTSLIMTSPYMYQPEINKTQKTDNWQCLPLSSWSTDDQPFHAPERYLLDLSAYKNVSFTINTGAALVELQHNKGHNNSKPFTIEYLEPYHSRDSSTCADYKNCLICVSDANCAWCDLKSVCTTRNQTDSEFCHNDNDVNDWKYLVISPQMCPNCSNHVNCLDCVQNGYCEWWSQEAKCERRGRLSEGVVSVESCPSQCSERRSCFDCLDNDRCVWCRATNECFHFAEYTSEYQFGRCREWIDRSVHYTETGQIEVEKPISTCTSCEKNTNCSDCLQTLGCGWCYDDNNPIQGVCTEGDFSNPLIEKCSYVMSNSTYEEDSSWAYAQCPDVDECGLGLHDCHKEAKCTNTQGSYSCQCKRGFIGDGKHSCTKTCYHKCVNGYCIGAPEYTCKCDLGWTGPDCAINCGCNNHSTCYKQPGICDQCQDWTTGLFCEHCKAGSYGNATSVEGCHKCDCNEHGDEQLGICDSITGKCYCKHYTEGDNCQTCKKGFFGDPKNGNVCYYQCMARGILSGMGPQGFGSKSVEVSAWETRLEGPPSKECLWIIDPENMQNNSTAIGSYVIQLTIDSDINVPCGMNSVYVYDGLPNFVSMSRTHPAHSLGVFCTRDSQYPLTIEGITGVMTVYYKQSEPTEGFNATYVVFSCPENCPSNRVCIENRCACHEGSTGVFCQDLICPNNCNHDKGHGMCDHEYGRCICESNYEGEDCSILVPVTNYLRQPLIFTDLFNSAHVSENLDHLRQTLPRFGHSVVATRRGQLWLFGGYSLSHGPLNDIRLFDSKNNSWMQVTVDGTNDAHMPNGRYFHAAEIVHSRREIFVFGGLTQIQTTFGRSIKYSMKILFDFWKFSLKDQRWIRIQTNNDPPPLAGHTLTLRSVGDKESLILIGGFSPDYGFLEDVWEYDLQLESWKQCKMRGYGPAGIYGHSAVYHGPTDSLYVFGGYIYSVNQTVMTDKLFVFNYEQQVWSVLPNFKDYNPPKNSLPRGRFLHSAVTTDEYMFVFGGRTDPPSTNDTLIAYSYACNQWIRLLTPDIYIIGLPPPLTHAHAMTLDIDTNSMYILGGFAGDIQSRVTRIQLPYDLCNLWSGKRDKCRSFIGCSFCELIGTNVSYCFTHLGPGYNPCVSSNGSSRTNNGVVCNANWIWSRACEQYTSCTDCLATWPNSYLEKTNVCTWCGNCGVKGKCVKDPLGCDNQCNTVTKVEMCPNIQCMATDCEKCHQQDNCLWSRKIGKSEFGTLLTGESLYDWSCNSQDLNQRSNIKIKNSSICPDRCSAHKSCETCLSSQGGEGGWHECRWSITLNECVSPSYQPLYCAGGVCGLVLGGGNVDRCPQPCSSYTQCSTCLRHTHCGWCALSQSNITGLGICTEGYMSSPASGPNHSCQELLNQMHNEPAMAPYRSLEFQDFDIRVDDRLSTSTDVVLLDLDTNPNGSVAWYYISCPPENECENGHHSCDKESEECVDQAEGFRCVCGKGYQSDINSQCVPICSQGCVRGECVKPDVCQCGFGYVGSNCTIQCECNGHSNCAGPDRLTECLSCQNNTQGPQCQRCKPLYVGNPIDHGQCVPCSEYCNGHSRVCVEKIESDPFDSMGYINNQNNGLIQNDGPLADAYCINCMDNTTGPRCSGCLLGHFRGSSDERDPCRPCECHGHGSTCDPVTGEKCDCQNNTESDTNCQSSGVAHHRTIKNNVQLCWMHQCSKCKDSYMGTPTDGHQCYKQMNVDFRFCLDAKLLEECKMKPNPLYPGQTSFFVVQPRFMNVDIRITVDITQGAVDFFLTSHEDIFIITKNTSLHKNVFDFDPRFEWLSEMETFERINEEGYNSSKNSKHLFTYQEHKTKGLSTYVTMKKSISLLIVKNVNNRLIITLPHDKHDLSSTRYYIALLAISSLPVQAAHVVPVPTYGTVFFRQDQLHIDLFVFFSVFFSCFFLFLAVCVVGWKAKQAADLRRARRQQVVEMLHMAKRPFAFVAVLFNAAQQPDASQSTRLGDIRPLAIEPTSNSNAAVTTLLIKLPDRGQSAGTRLALGSTLVLNMLNQRGYYSSNANRHNSGGPRHRRNAQQ
ncbi:multiple epidermal growth factor-like domains protein 8 [Adelges cooleyi]|uniref:multiple epidermal growth factor-like domains protein 8 n=1 Tax=Adelges cooleyi TaxID=133065 RepID=UPI00217F23BD|nr:multiple epidermal growth factor-like domains protein 8 [Adelges cooleyi]XP_050427056.1 multiple epidermal growth factor-like domains protein 8 [Adelges cooleyi]